MVRRELSPALALVALAAAAACTDEVTFVPVEPKLVIQPAEVDFGDVVVGLTSRLELTLTNAGNARLEIAGAAADAALGAEFTITDVPTDLAEGGEARVVLSFAPSSLGERSGVVTFETNQRETPKVDVRVKGRGVDPALVARPTVVDFGRVIVGRSRTATVVIENTSSGPVELVRVAPDVGTSAEFSGEVQRQTLGAGQSVSVVLRYAPTDVGADAGKLVVIDNSRRPEALAIQVRGLGAATDVEVEPRALDFTGLVAGTTQAKRFVIRNVGVDAHQVTRLALVSTGTTGAAEWSVTAPALPLTLAAGAAQEVEVTYAPRDAGRDTDGVRVESTGLDAPVTVMLTGQAGEAPRPEISVTPLSLDFGQVELAQTLRLPVRIDSVGTAPLVVTSVELAPAGGPYALEMAPNAGDSYPPAGTHTLQVAFTPSVVGRAPGAELVIRTNAATSPTMRIPIVGEGVNRAVPIVEVTPNPVDFGRVPRGTAAQRAITVRNVGTAPLTVSDLRLVNDQMGRFTITMNIPQNSALAPTQQASATIQYLDQGVVAAYVGQLEVRTTDPRTPVVTVPLTATTEPPPVTATDISLTMTWTRTPADIDLHLIAPGGTLFDAPLDNCFCNPNPDWGVVGQPQDDPFLDRDDVVGPGPENINLTQAASGDYTVVVHSFVDTNPSNDVTVVVNLGGTRVATVTRAITNNQRWTVGTIRWNAVTRTGTWTQSVLPPFASLIRLCY